MRTLLPVFLLASVAFPGCASPGLEPQDAATRRDPDWISSEELRGLPGGTVYEAVERLRPNWLRSRGSFGINQPAVYPEVFLDEQHFGPLAHLRQLNLETVEEIRFMDARDATTRFGTGYPGGIILVFLKKSPNKLLDPLRWQPKSVSRGPSKRAYLR